MKNLISVSLLIVAVTVSGRAWANCYDEYQECKSDALDQQNECLSSCDDDDRECRRDCRSSLNSDVRSCSGRANSCLQSNPAPGPYPGPPMPGPYPGPIPAPGPYPGPPKPNLSGPCPNEAYEYKQTRPGGPPVRVRKPNAPGYC
jgi:hypothetical protein